MGATEIVAIVGAVSTPAVAFAGYWFNERRSRDDRAATQQITEDSHRHERQLAEGQREHEAQLRRSERAYNDRRDTYVELLNHAMILVERVDLTEPIITYENMPKPPENPSPDKWRDLQARVTAYGSQEVGEAADEFYAKARAFFVAADVYRMVKNQPGATFEQEGQAMLAAREEVGRTFKRLQILVREDLANL
jgi:hypothetical protein